MRTWDFAVDLDRTQPLARQIADAVARAIEAGGLEPGAPLPGTRELARRLDVNRNTVVAAYGELASQGFVAPLEARGTVVADDWREARPHPARRTAAGRGRSRGRRRSRSAGAAAAGFDVALGLPALPRPRSEWPAGTLVMQSGVPDVRLLPVEEIARAYRRALRAHGSTLLAYGDERGHPRLRAALAAMLASRRGLAVGPDDVVVVRGSQMGIDLVARLLIKPGDVVAVEELGYSPAWAALLHAGARLVPLPVDEGGVDVGALATLTRSTRVRAVYVTPHHQYPTMVTLAAPRRRALLDVCAAERVAVIEDDYDHELQYEGRPPLPLAAQDTAGVVVSIGTLSKILAPGLRLGFVTGPRAVVDELARLRRHVDRQGDLAVEEAVAELLEDGTVLRHVRRMRRVYRERRDLIVDELRALGFVFDVPRGGMAIWARLPDGARADVFEEEAAAAGVGIATTRGYALAPEAASRPCVRLGFAALDEAELREAARRLGRALRATLR